MTIKSIQTKLKMHWFSESGCELARIIFVLQWSHFVTSGGNDKAVESKGTTCPTPFKNMYTSVVLKIQASWTNNQGAKLICSNLGMYRRLFCVCLKSLSFRLSPMLRRGLFSLFSSWGRYSTWCDVSNNSRGKYCFMLLQHTGGGSCQGFRVSPVEFKAWLVVTSEWFHLGHELRVAVLSSLLDSKEGAS